MLSLKGVSQICKGKGKRRSKEWCKEIDSMYCRALASQQALKRHSRSFSRCVHLPTGFLWKGCSEELQLSSPWKKEGKGRIYLPAFLLSPVPGWWRFIPWGANSSVLLASCRPSAATRDARSMPCSVIFHISPEWLGRGTSWERKTQTHIEVVAVIWKSV